MKARRDSDHLTAVLFLAATIHLAACAAAPPVQPAANLTKTEITSAMTQVYALEKVGDKTAAERLLQQVLSSDSANVPARVELAYIMVADRRWHEAILLLDSLIDEDPGNLRFRMQRGYARLAMGERTSAADDFLRVDEEPSEFSQAARDALSSISKDSTKQSQDARGDALTSEGYAALHAGDDARARDRFHAALIETPGNTEVLKQLGYMSLADGDMVDAVRDFSGVHLLVPTDYSTSLALGYIYNGLQDDAGAKVAFENARPSPDPEIHEAAVNALTVLRAKTDPLYFDVYASPLYSTRFADAFAYAEAIAGYKLTPGGPISVYFASRYAQDTRSRTLAVPEIYSDNFVFFGPGIRLQPTGYNASLSAEWGGAVNLLRTSDHPASMESNARVVLADYHYLALPHSYFLDLGGSAGYYSRSRDNLIAYLQGRAGWTVADQHHLQWSLFVPANGYRDHNHDFYNNAVETGIGAEVRLPPKWGLQARVEYLRGFYMGVHGRDPNPYGAHYNDVRFMLIYSGHFTREYPYGEYEPTRRRGFTW